MQVQGLGTSNYTSSIYANSSDACYSNACIRLAANDSVSISDAALSLSPDIGEAAEVLNDLYSQKAQAECELGDLKCQSDDATAKIDARKQELIQNKQGDQASEQTNEKYNEAKAEYDNASAAKKEAQQELSHLTRENSTNDQAINSNAQHKQQNSQELSSAQSELNSLTPPTAPSGDDEEAQASYQAELEAYNAKKSELESKISRLEAKQQQLESEAQQLQGTKDQLAQQMQEAQSNIEQQDAAMQAAQAKIEELQQQIDGDPELQQAINEDSELKSLQEEAEQIQQQQTDKEAEIAQLETQIAEAEAKNEGLQSANADAASQDFQATAEEAGFDLAASVDGAQESVAQKKYGKSYEELTAEEQMAIEADIDGEITLGTMEQARQILEEDPNNEAALAVLEKGQGYMEAQENLTLAELSTSIEALPADMREGAAAAIAEARANGENPDSAAMEALKQYASASAESYEFSASEKEALQKAVGAADSYYTYRECNAQAKEMTQASAPAQEEGTQPTEDGANYSSASNLESDVCGKETSLDDMKRTISEKYGIETSDVQVLSGTGRGDTINVTSNDDGNIVVSVNGTEHTYTPDEAKKLIIDGGAGDDNITVDESVTANLNIVGGKGDDTIYGGSGNDYIVDDYGHNEIHGGAGNDTIKIAGKGERSFGEFIGDVFSGEATLTNTVYGDGGNDTIYGGDAQDTINGGGGNDTIYGGKGNDTIKGMSGNDIIVAGDGNDYVDGGTDDDLIDGGKGNDKLYGSGGNDTIYGRDGKDKIYGGFGEDTIFGGKGKDTIDGGDGKDTIATVDGENSGRDTIVGDSNDQKFEVSEDVSRLRETMANVPEEKINYAFGTDGDDEINITAGSSYGTFIVSVNGEEREYTRTELSNMIIDGGAGNDKIHIDDNVNVNLHITGGLGNDTIYGGAGADTIYDNYGSNTIHGGAGNDVIVAHGWDENGLSGNRNIIYGDDGRDYIETGDGNDLIYGGNGGDVIFSGDGNDSIYAGEGDDFVNAGHGNDTVYGGNGNDTMFGLAGDDKLYGGAGTDTIASGDGNDTIDGGADNDIIRYTDSTHGHDTLQNAEEGDDAAALDPIYVPDNFSVDGVRYHNVGSDNAYTEKLNSADTLAFQNLMYDNLEAFAAIEPGQQLLNGIAETGQTVTFAALGDNNGYCSQHSSSGNATITTDSAGNRTYTPGSGSSSTVKINPAFIDFGDGSSYGEQNTMLIMAHEMCHAYNNATGTMDRAFYSTDTGELLDLPESTSSTDGFRQRAIRGAELQAVGIYDDSTVFANPYGMSENDYRQYFHMHQRDSYMKQSVSQYENGNKGGIDWEEWSDYDLLAQNLAELRSQQ